MTWLDHAGHGACEGPKRHFSSTGTRNMSFSIRVCALVMAFSPCRSRKRPYHGLGARLRWPFAPSCRGKGNHGNMACACDSLSPLPVEETAIMGTWLSLANPFSPYMSRKRQSWGACDSLFPLPVEEKDCRGTLQGSVAGVRTELCRALKGSAELCRASGAAG